MAGGVNRGRIYGTADMSSNVRYQATTLTQGSPVDTGSSRAGTSAETAAAREEAANAREEAARAREEAAKAREETADLRQRFEEFMARFTTMPQGAPHAAYPQQPLPTPPSAVHHDYLHDFTEQDQREQQDDHDT